MTNPASAHGLSVGSVAHLRMTPEDSGRLRTVSVSASVGAAIRRVCMQPAGDEAARRFVADLVRLRQDAGMPSYSTLERLSERRLSRSTMSDILTGKRIRIPEWRFVAVFVAACRAAAQESALNPDDLGTPAAWKRRWDDAVSGFADPAYPGPGDVRPSREDNALRPGPAVGTTEPSPRVEASARAGA